MSLGRNTRGSVPSRSPTLPEAKSDQWSYTDSGFPACEALAHPLRSASGLGPWGTSVSRPQGRKHGLVAL